MEVSDKLFSKLTQRGLSRKEVETVNEVVKGVTNKAAADALFVCEKTVKFHLTNVYRKLSLKNRAELIVDVHHMMNPGLPQ